MILVANSRVAHETARRKTPNGWHTTFIGQNRNTLKDGEAPPPDDALYPMAFLVEKDPGAVVGPHFHQADQYQVIMQGSGRMGVHDVADVAVHYTDAYSAYGPIVAAEDGIAWFTLRNTWDPGARYMPEHRAQLRAARATYQHREATCGPLQPLDDAARVKLQGVEAHPVIEPSPDGMGTWRYAAAPAALIAGPEPASGGGQFWLVTAGSAEIAGSEALPAQSCIFVGPDDAAPRIKAGSTGADLLCLQFPRKPARD